MTTTRRWGRIAATAAIALVATVCAAPPALAQPERRSAGCGQAAPQDPGTSVLQTVRSGDRDRTYQLHLPPGYDPARAWPVVLVFHGRGNSGARTEEFSKLSTLPAIVAYPNGVVGQGDGERQAWQGAPYSAPGVDDLAFTSDLLDRLESGLCVDERRVYATGKSNGAGFTGILACRASERITAIAPVAGAFYGTGEPPCEPARAVPVIEFHGTGDATIPYTGDTERGLPAIADWAAAWAQRDGCHAGPQHETVGADVTVSRWTGCEGGAQVRHVAVEGGGHTWPGSDSYSGGGHTTQTIEAHEVAWEFLRHHRLPVKEAS
ncbi:PHB depolymerase family esterase [Pseudonocardia sp. MH-G8]|uniref:alpha/beta hydrolase family esterase n=1 Tax=Pseudonocardia sp. MH-G8 TaxID=1854588 RepID=UPI000BA07408|nr:PHB depolymerase family esterase [Pseudonocardia sp. MH-G8]OZM79130.1 poly(3-hydroxybutyrate) depolymerase [Pseudonocardia sp. MH-G8]